MEQTLLNHLPEALGYLFLGGALWGIVERWRQDEKVRQSQYWPWVRGRITHSEVERGLSTGGRMAKIVWGGYRRDVCYLDIEYEYTVGSETYTGNTICLGGEFETSFRGRAEARCQKYPVDAEVDVYYNHQDPEDSCLERRSEAPWLSYLISAFFAVFGLLLVTGRIG